MEQQALVSKYSEHLLEKNKVLNLTGAKTVEDFQKKHVADVIEALKVARPLTDTVVDLGSGCGVPGILLAILRPGSGVFLAEKTLKKAKALEQLVQGLELDNVKVLSGRAEENSSFPRDAELWCRAFLPGVKLGRFFSENFEPTDFVQIVLMKGPRWREEKEEILREKSIRKGWKERFRAAEEVYYELPEDLGKRCLVYL